MQEVTVRVQMSQDSETGEWTATSADLPAILERGDELGELIARVQSLAFELAQNKGLLDETKQQKFSVEVSFG